MWGGGREGHLSEDFLPAGAGWEKRWYKEHWNCFLVASNYGFDVKGQVVLNLKAERKNPRLSSLIPWHETWGPSFLLPIMYTSPNHSVLSWRKLKQELQSQYLVKHFSCLWKMHGGTLRVAEVQQIFIGGHEKGTPQKRPSEDWACSGGYRMLTGFLLVGEQQESNGVSWKKEWLIGWNRSTPCCTPTLWVPFPLPENIKFLIHSLGNQNH